MTEYDSKIHHRRSIRLKGYDYSQAGLHFITIVTQERAALFGEVVNGEMRLNRYGELPKHGNGWKHNIHMLNWARGLSCPIIFMES